MKSGDSNNHSISPETLEYFYNLLYPVGFSMVGQYPPGGDASGNGLYNTVWSKVSGANGRYIRIDNSASYGSTVAEQLPNIKAAAVFDVRGQYANDVGGLQIRYTSGAITTQTESNWYCTNLTFTSGSTTLARGIKFNAYDSNHTYVDGGKVQPLGYNVYLWQRTS